ncbi:pyrroline-5-carboxylate reductase [Deltaproteobacteria bacterium PRO3]|nr:pyrroline-5-carboxylate reductase [Deltaproteobacteria bacterium PRO3]
MKLKSKYRYGFIGIGKMAQAILGSMLRAGLAKPSEVLVSDPSATTLREAARRFRVATTVENAEVAKRCEWIWLGTKPFHAAEVLRGISPDLRKGQTLLSMMAGVSTRSLRRWAGPAPALVRFMPNTPALLGAGATGVYFAAGIPPTLRKRAEKIFAAMGKYIAVPREALLDGVTGLSGSGPAFVYLVALGLIEGGRRAGLKPDQAKALAVQTLLGASRMLAESGQAPETLIQHVATKGGTTEAGLKVLEDRGLRAILAEAVAAATRRAAEIREQNECTR